MKSPLVAAPALLLVTSCALVGPNERRGIETVMQTGRVLVEARFENVGGQRVLRGFTAERRPYTTQFLSGLDVTLYIDSNGDGLPTPDESRAVWSVASLDGTASLALNGSFKRAKDDLFVGPALVEIRVGYVDAEGTVTEESAVSPIDI
jgi:hypothetical protein